MTAPPLLEVRRDLKYGGFDFGVNCSLVELSREEMAQFREMVVVAIGTAEDMWRREQERKNPAQQAPTPADQPEKKPTQK